MIKYLSHPNKELSEHLGNVKANALKLFFEGSFEKYELKTIISAIALYHDLGKSTSYFQDYLKGQKVGFERTHARIGAYVVLNYLLKELPDEQNKKILLVSLAMLAVLWHHRNLNNPKVSELYTPLFDTTKEIFYKQIQNLKQQAKNIPFLKAAIPYLDTQIPTLFKKFWHNFFKNVPATPEYYFLFNYIFSLLIEADKLDASETPIYEHKPIPIDIVDNQIQKFPQNELSKLRTQARKEVVANVGELNLDKNHLFTLSAPTGIGKTLTSLEFSIKLRNRIAHEKGYQPLIIYALPFINIIEQTYEVFKEVFGDKYRILAHYQFADVFSQFGSKNDEDDELNLKVYHRNLMSLDTWQADIVITTFVQFFKTLITGKNRLLKKFNHLAGSIIIIDEIQTLPVNMLPLLGAMLYFLTEYLRSYIIVMTATQPGIFKLTKQVLSIESFDVRNPIKELLPNNAKYFNYFKRTKIIPLIDKELDKEDEFLEIFKQRWDKTKSALIVVNTIKRSIKIYNALKEHLANFPIFYLSTNITPLEKEQRVKEIKTKLENRERLILVSTQVVEAGVDLDFDMAFRDIGPIDSIVQIAGRINRNYKKGEYLPLYVVHFKDDASRIYGTITVDQTLKALSGYKEVSEHEYKKLVEKYFTDLAERKSFDDYVEIFNAIKSLDYSKIEEFEVIKNDYAKYNIFIELDLKNSKVKANEVVDAYQKLKNGEMKKAEFDTKYKLAFNQRIISIALNKIYFSQNIEPYLAKLDENYFLLPSKYISLNKPDVELYNIETGFRRDLTDESASFII